MSSRGFRRADGEVDQSVMAGDAELGQLTLEDRGLAIYRPGNASDEWLQCSVSAEDIGVSQR